MLNRCPGPANGLCTDLLFEAYLQGLPLTYTLVNGSPISLPSYYTLLYPGFTAQWASVGPNFVLWNDSLVLPPFNCTDDGVFCVPFESQNLTAPPLVNTNYTINNVTGVLQPFTYQWLYGIENLVCASGTDCTDCGCSARVSPLPAPGVDCSMNNTLDIFANATLHAISLNLTTVNITLDCPYHCPFVQCADGSCADTQAGCMVTYNCPGDGCLRASNGEYYCACQLYASGIACEITRCDPKSTNPYAACLCGAPGPLRIQPPALNLEYELTPGQINQVRVFCFFHAVFPSPLFSLFPYSPVSPLLTPDSPLPQLNYQYSPQNGSNDIQYKVSLSMLLSHAR